MNKNIIKNISIVILIVIIIILVVFIILNNNKEENKINNEKNTNNEVSNTTNNDNNTNDNNYNNDNTNNNDNNPNTKNNSNYNNNTNNNSNNTPSTEADVINYVSALESEIENESSLDKIKTKAKDSFITIVDFIFYDKEIKGYTFSELTDSAKLKIISIALKIDSKIEEYIPNYKESISSTYNKAKDKLVMLYLDTTISICSNNQEECNKAKEIFSNIKDKANIGFSYIKEIAINGKNKIKDYYEIFRNS